MFDFKFTCDNGTITIVRANKRSTAIKLFCEAEGCSLEWVEKHCIVRKVFVKKSAEELLEEYYEREGISKHQKGYVKASMVVYYIEQIMKEERQNEENIHK